MYENLLRLPYFQGMSKNELTTIIEKVKLDFTRHKNGERILSQGDKCEKFVILLSGSIESERISSDESYILREMLTPPHAIEPYSLFGARPEYSRTYYSKGECSTLSFDKSFYYSQLSKYNIFSINMLNLISLKAQAMNNTAWQEAPQSIEGRIARFIALRCEVPTGNKRLTIKMERLAQVLGETRLNISRTLNSLQNRGLVELSRKEIFIPSFERLSAATADTHIYEYAE